MTPRTEAVATAITELSEEERAELFELFVVDVEYARVLGEMKRVAEDVELERYRGPVLWPR